MRRIATLPALAACFAAPALAQDRATTTEWFTEPLPTGVEIEVGEGVEFLQAVVAPPTIALDAPAASAEHGELLPAGGRLFRLKTRTTPVYCTPQSAGRWGAIRRMVAVHLCLVDDDADGRLDSYYVERPDHAVLPLFRGTFPAARHPLPAPLAYSQLAPEPIWVDNRPGVARNRQLSIFLRWSSGELGCYFGYPYNRILYGALEREVRLPEEAALPATISICGASLRVVSRANRRLRLVLEHTYPSPIEVGRPWQLF